MDEIILNGINVKELQKQRDAIREEAAKFISDNLDLANELTHKLIKSENKEEIEVLLQEAYEVLHNTNLVSDVSGVSFYLPYSQDYCYDDEIVFSSELSRSKVLEDLWDNGVQQLYALYRKMEDKSHGWHASYC